MIVHCHCQVMDKMKNQTFAKLMIFFSGLPLVPHLLGTLQRDLRRGLTEWCPMDGAGGRKWWHRLRWRHSGDKELQSTRLCIAIASASGLCLGSMVYLDNMLPVLRIRHKSAQAQCIHMAASWRTAMPRSGIRARAMQQ